MSRIAIVGSHKHWKSEDSEKAKDVISFLIGVWSESGHNEDFNVVSGGAEGVDTWAADLAGRYGYVPEEFLPDKDKYGLPRAYFVRNRSIAEAVDVIYAFYSTDAISPGTKSTVKYGLMMGKDAFDWHPGFSGPRPVMASECHPEYDYHSDPHRGWGCAKATS
jgi:hypothetical protein